MEPKGFADRSLRMAGLEQGDHFFVTRQPSFPPQFRLCRSGPRRLNIRTRFAGSGKLRFGSSVVDWRQDQLSASFLEHPLHRRRQIQNEVEAISDLL